MQCKGVSHLWQRAARWRADTRIRTAASISHCGPFIFYCMTTHHQTFLMHPPMAFNHKTRHGQTNKLRSLRDCHCSVLLSTSCHSCQMSSVFTIDLHWSIHRSCYVFCLVTSLQRLSYRCHCLLLIGHSSPLSYVRRIFPTHSSRLWVYR